MNLTDMTKQELEDFIISLGHKKFRADQVYTWINRGCTLEQMTNIPKDLKDDLKKYPFGGAVCLNIDDNFLSVVKHLHKLDDGHVVESVLMNYNHGNSLCISSQVGCGMGCTFCASTIDGVVRNMTAGEMLFTVANINNKFSTKDRRGVTNIVIMGSGEPLCNYDNVVKFIHLCKDGLGISMRNISLSTCGIVENIIKLADENIPINLCLSLHAPNDTLRQSLMPVASKYTIKQTLDACKYYFAKTKRQIIIEYVLIGNINDSEDQANELSSILANVPCHVNIIPYNIVKEKDYVSPSNNRLDRFVKTLDNNNISVTKRRELGDNIDAACGQLRRDYISQSDK